MADLLKAPTCRLLGSVMKSQIDKRTSKTGKVHIATSASPAHDRPIAISQCLTDVS